MNKTKLHKIYAGNIPFKVTEVELRSFFGDGSTRRILDVKIVTDRETGRPCGYAFITVSSDAEVESAIKELDQVKLGGRPVTVAQAIERSEKKKIAGGRDKATGMKPRRQYGSENESDVAHAAQQAEDVWRE